MALKGGSSRTGIIEKRGGYSSGSTPASQLKPPPPSIMRPRPVAPAAEPKKA